MRNLLILITFCISISAFSADYRTGDAELDRWLVNIDFVNQKDPDQTIAKLSKEFNVDVELIMPWRSQYELSVAQITAAVVANQVLEGDLEATLKHFSKTPVKRYKQMFAEIGLPDFSDQFKQFRAAIAKRAPKKDLEAESRNIFNKDNELGKPKQN